MNTPDPQADAPPPLDPGIAEAVVLRAANIASTGMALPAGLRAAAAEAESPRMAAGLRALAFEIEHGRALDECVGSVKGLPPYVAGLIRAAQRTGDAGLTLATWTENRRSAMHHWRSALVALSYPALCVLGAAGLFVFLEIMVVPVFRRMFDEFGLKLPKATAFLFRTTDFFDQFALPAGLLVLLVLLATRLIGGKAGWSWLIGSMPLIGRIWQWTAVAEMLRGLGLLLQYRVPLPEALRLTADGITDSYVAEQCHKLATRVEGGTSLTMSLVHLRTFPLTIVPLVRWGEQHGTLDDAMRSAAEMLENRLRVRTGILAQVVPPLVFVLVGIFVASTFIALFMPLISLIQGLS
jgi:type II secretory pathway component PulF